MTTADPFDDPLDLLGDLLDVQGIDNEAGAVIARRPPDAAVPMSFSQELLWLLDRATPGLTAYNLTMSHRLRGGLDLAALTRALSLLAARHESLRSRFADADGEHCLLIDPPTPVTVDLVDLSELPPHERGSEAQRAARERGRRPFDLTREHLFRPILIRLAPEDHVLLIGSHHIVLDGLSLGILYREVSAAYSAYRAGQQPALPPLPVQFGDFAIWQRTYLSGARLERLLAFWRTQLGDATAPLALPTDRPRSAVPTFAGARQTLVLPAEALASVKALAQRHQVTLYMALLAAYGAVLHRYTGRPSVLVGSGSAGRSTQQMESIVGYLNNTLVQRLDFTGNPTFAELLARVRGSALGAYDHQEVPLEKLVLELRQGQDRLDDAPLFEVVLTMQETGSSGLELDGLRVEPFGVDVSATKFDLTLLVTERPDGLQLTAQYRSDLFEPPTMQRFLGHLRSVLEAAVVDPDVRVSALPLLTPAERTALAGWNATSVDTGPPATLTELFEATAARVPDRLAAVGAAAVTFADLNARANQLAYRLRALGVVENTPAGLLLDRSVDAIVGLLGILKAGGGYVPLSLEAPAARLAHQLRECGASVVVTVQAQAELLPANVTTIALDRGEDAAHLATLPVSNPAPLTTPRSLAYVLYTSGSTGTPKGVAVTHANAVHYTRAVSRVMADIPSAEDGDGFTALDGFRFAMASTLAADLGNTSLLPSLLSGATLHLLSKEVTTDPVRYQEYLTANRIDVLKITPSHLTALTAGRTGGELTSALPGRWLVLGGEALRPDLARALLDAGSCRVLNHYGPTETTVGACTLPVTSASLDQALALGAQTVPIGRPLANMHAYVVDGHDNQQPVGVPGELLLGGAGVAQGYFGRPDLTAERFTTFRGERVYRTGDRVRRLSDGTIEFLGRADDQVKVRGYRVELGEIEQVLAGHPAVAHAVVGLPVKDGEEPQLVAYVVLKPGGSGGTPGEPPGGDSLREWLGTQLPGYMVPAAFVLLDRIPLTPNGKVDRAKLPAPGTGSGEARRSHIPPRTETETTLAAIWEEVLKKEKVGISDDFLLLGGHSLLAIRMLGKISRALGVRLPLRTLFDSPTIEQLARAVEAERTVAAPAPTIGARTRDTYRMGKTAPDGPQEAP